MHDLVDRYQRRLDVEVYKFKMELEADNRGITEVLEKSKNDFHLFIFDRNMFKCSVHTLE